MKRLFRRWKKKQVPSIFPSNTLQHHRHYVKYLINDGKEDWYTSMVNFKDACDMDDIELYEALLDLAELRTYIRDIPSSAAPDIESFKTHVECRINIAQSHYLRFSQ